MYNVNNFNDFIETGLKCGYSKGVKKAIHRV